MDNENKDKTLEDLLESFRFMQKGRIYDFPDWAVE